MQDLAKVQRFIGVDVAKAELVVCEGIDGVMRAIPNRADAIAGWLRVLPADASIAMESTGRYHRLLATLAHQAGLAVYVLNARDVHFYAKALGSRAKTDAVDARIIARYLAGHRDRLHAWGGGQTSQDTLQLLLARRTQLAQQRSSVAQVLNDGLMAYDEAGAVLASFDALLKRLDAEIASLVQADPLQAERYRCLLTIPGIGAATGSMLVALFSRLPFANADAVVAYSGLDPRANDSGTRRGRRRLSKRGPAQLRRNLYMAGFAASRSNALKPLYQALRARGLSTTASFVILGRKLLRVAFSMWRSSRPFDLDLIGPKRLD